MTEVDLNAGKLRLVDSKTGRKPGRHLSNVNQAWHTLRRRAKLNDARLLGHRRIQSTARYAHLAPDAAYASTERIAQSVASDLGLDWMEGSRSTSPTIS